MWWTGGIVTAVTATSSGVVSDYELFPVLCQEKKRKEKEELRKLSRAKKV